MSQFPVLFPDTGAGNRWPHVIFFSQFPFSTLKPPNGFPKIGNGISSIFPKPLTKPAESQCYLKGARCHFHCSDLIALLLHYWRACGPSPHPTIQIFQGPLNIYIFTRIPNFSNFTWSFNFRIGSGNGSGNLQFPGPQRVDPEMVFIFSVDSSRVDAISGLLCSLVTAWKPKVANFFFRDGH